MIRPLLPLLAASLALRLCGAEAPTLPGSQPLTLSGDLSVQMHEAAIREIDKKIAESPRTRPKPDRQRFRKIIGVVDPRVAPAMERFGDDANPALVAETKRFHAYQVRWPVFERITGEGLLLEPKGSDENGRSIEQRGFVIALPDADQTPEQFAGLAPGVPVDAQLARRLAENGYTVLVPMLIDRSDRGSGDPSLVMTNLPHREWIHRQAWMMGRNLIGYEVQKVLAAVDWWKMRGAVDPKVKNQFVGVAGYGEGGLVAFYAAAADERIGSTLISGYFRSRQQTWREPLYRDVWGLLREFGDAEIASLVLPRRLVIEYRAEPKVDSHPPARKGQKDMVAPGALTTPSFEEVEAEYKRIEQFTPGHHPDALRLIRTDATAALDAFRGVTAFLTKAPNLTTTDTGEPAKDRRRAFHPEERQLRQVRELNDHIQLLVRNSDRTRDAFFLHKVVPEFANVRWNYELDFPAKSADSFVSAAPEYRRMFWEEILGKLDDPLPPPNPRTRLIHDRPKWTGYEVVLDTGGEGFAWGVLLLPKDIRAGERRPVVVCQHGRNGLPSDTIEGDKPAYHNFAARLAERGFIVLAPHNLYRHEPTYRLLARKAHTVKATHWSFILRHHQQWLAWLASLPQVDAKRIGFYGLSFGGESAMRLPPLLEGYALSICSGDFNDWTRKVTSTHDRKSFMFSDEWEIACFDMGGTFSYAELSYLIFPRPFMVERGHHDGVALDAWVASEYGKVRWFYDQFGLGNKTAIEFFNGGHVINGQGTFDFLHQHLNWPKPE